MASFSTKSRNASKWNESKKYLEKFGGSHGVVEAYGPILERTKSDNIDAKLDKIKVTPNTMNAHRIIHWSKIEGCQNQIVSNYLKHFVNGLDLGDINVLAKLASKYFMDEKSILRLLTSDNDLTNITEKDHTARQMGIKAVPMFIVANQYAVSGAQSTGFWQNVVIDIQNSIS